MNYSQEDYLVLLSTCQVTKGSNRNILIDYAHDSVYEIGNDHVQLLHKLRETPILNVSEQIEDDESKGYFEEFISFLISQEMAVVTPHPENFPEISKSLHNDSLKIIDSILEVAPDSSLDGIEKFCREISELGCQEIVVWFVSESITMEIIDAVFDILTKYDFSYIEAHCTYNGVMKNREIVWSFVENHASLKRVYLYSAEKKERVDVVNIFSDLAPMSLGEFITVEQNFNDGNCCGQIHFESLDFSGYWVTNMLLKKNGCLYKKVSLKKDGTIVNCPCLDVAYGNIRDTTVENVIQKKTFKRWGEIKKDDIHVCKECEYRYNCTDCRAFRLTDDIFSKPSKCKYNPRLSSWE